jgi:hypothetical protein
MNKLMLILLSIILIFMLLLGGILLYVFSPSGNDMLRSYLQKELQGKSELDVEVRKFTLGAGKASALVRLDQQADIEVVTHFDLLSQSVKGIYQIKSDSFMYNEMSLKDVAIQGSFEGISEDMSVQGNGKALDADLAFQFRLIDHKPQKIEVSMKGTELAELLVLTGQPPLANGNVDIDINMPDIGEEFASGYGNIVLHEAFFDTDVVKKVYDLDIPPKSIVSANIDMKLQGNTLNLVALSKSNLFDLKVDNAMIGLKDKHVEASYTMDVKEMGILSQNRLAGPLKVMGEVQVKEEMYHIKGGTNSLGGKLLFDVAKTSKLHFENLDISKILYLTKQPAYATGILSGSGDIDKEISNGRFDIRVKEGQFGAKSIEERFGYQIPEVNHFTFQSEGKLTDKILEADIDLDSSLSDMKFEKVIYNTKAKKLHADYDVFLPNIGLLIPDNQAVKRGYMSLKGKMAYDKTFKVEGSAKGLGEKLDFFYDSKSATIDAENLFVEKLLSLSALPRYVKGKVSTKVNVTDIKNLNGSFVISSKELITQPNEMERLIDKKLNIHVALESKGKVHKGVLSSNSSINTSIGKIKLTNTQYNIPKKHYTSEYIIEIPELKDAYVLTDKKLYGPMLLKGDIVQDNVLKVNGSTDTLGGKIDYQLIDNLLKGKLTKVPLENILALLGHDKVVQGDAYGTIDYDTKAKTGVIDIDIQNFQIKSSSTTETVKMFIGKDPARIIYSSTKLNATLNGDVTTYTLHAKGSSSTIDISDGKIDKKSDTHHAKFKFVYEKYIVTGTIAGSVDQPKIMVDPAAFMQSKTGEKIQKNLDKALGEDMGKAVGGFLKGLKF